MPHKVVITMNNRPPSDITLNVIRSAGIEVEYKSADTEQQVISAGHFHGMPLALAMSAVKAAIPVLAAISERRLNKLVDPATSDGLPGFLIGNEDGTESGFMIVQYTAAAISNAWRVRKLRVPTASARHSSSVSGR